METNGEANGKAGVCQLCEQYADLRESHIYPKFFFDWLKTTSGLPSFRGAETPNRALQDGHKPRALCEQCEQRFSLRENWFAQCIFRPFILKGAIPNRLYDERLFYFLVSLAWRLIVLSKAQPPADHSTFQQVRAAEREWRDYLLTGTRPQTFNVFHLILTDPADKLNFPIKNLRHLHNFHRWFKRDIDGSVVTCNDNCIVYIKLPGILVFAPITELDDKYMVGTKIHPAGGTIPKRQRVLDHWLLSILEQRAISTDDELSALNEKQVQRNLKGLLANPNSDRVTQLMADVHATSARIRKQRGKRRSR